MQRHLCSCRISLSQFCTMCPTLGFPQIRYTQSGLLAMASATRISCKSRSTALTSQLQSLISPLMCLSWPLFWRGCYAISEQAQQCCLDASYSRQ